MNLLRSLVLFAVLGFAYSQSCNQVDRVGLLEVDGNVVVEWNGNDNCEYQINYSSNVPGGTDRSLTTSGTSHTFTDLVPCSTISVSVALVGGTAVSASLTLQISVKEPPVLRDMITSCNSIQMIWDAQPYNENMCEVTHFQMFCLSDTHNFTIPQQVTDVEHRTFNILITVLRPDVYYTCNGFMFTTLGGFSPASDNIEFWSNLDSVRALEVEETETSIKARWEAPLNSDECGVAYEVTYENEVLGTVSVEVVGTEHDLDVELIPCTDYTISVTPISFTGSKGTAVSTEITPSVRVGQAEDVQIVDNGNSLTFQWAAVNVGRCPVNYIVQYAVDGQLSDIISTDDNDATFDRVTCATSSFTVRAISEGISGTVSTQEIVLDVTDITSIGEVTNVRLVDDAITWDAPISIGFCSISYVVGIENIFGAEEKLVSDTSVNVNLIPCSANKVTVTGVSGDVNGESGTFEIEAPSAEFSAPTHLQTEPSFTSAKITLEADSPRDNLCVIAAAAVECSNDNGDSFERSLDVDDNESRIHSIEVNDLELDTIYTCVARWEGSSSGTEFSFRTVPLIENALRISNVNKDSFLISWTEEYGQQFVTGYSLIVESIGPLHVVPDNCDIERGAAYSFELGSTDLSQVFVEGFPNYGYRVYLTTSYTLGIRTNSELSDIQTLTSVPDSPENISADWVRGEEDGYSYSAVVNWNTPCGLNGRLESFSVSIIAEFAINGNNVNVEVDSGVDVDESIVNSSYNYKITDINPFFTYYVAVYPEAASTGAPALIVLNPPGVCACLDDDN